MSLFSKLTWGVPTSFIYTAVFPGTDSSIRFEVRHRERRKLLLLWQHPPQGLVSALSNLSLQRVIRKQSRQSTWIHWSWPFWSVPWAHEVWAGRVLGFAGLDFWQQGCHEDGSCAKLLEDSSVPSRAGGGSEDGQAASPNWASGRGWQYLCRS